MTLSPNSEIKASFKEEASSVKKDFAPKKAEAFRKHLKVEEVEEEPKQSFFELLQEKERLPESKDKKFQASDSTPNVTLPYSFMGMSQTSIESLSASAISRASGISPDVALLVETMISSMNHMVDLNNSETTLSLDAEQFAHSPFYKSQIVIREFSTAPKAFNIELLGSPEAVLHFNQHLGALMAAFESVHTNFKVNRLEARYTSSEQTGIGRKSKNEKEWQTDDQLNTDPDERGST